MDDLSFLDRPEILETIFPVAYSPHLLPDFLRAPDPDFPAHQIEVEEGIRIACGLWLAGKECPSILYFHGNGETVPGHAWIAPLYNERGINLFVADFRGYGASNGMPTISNMLTDAHVILEGFIEIMRSNELRDSLFLMGRSLGSVPAIELAANHQDKIRGLIVESGSANSFRQLRSYLEADTPGAAAAAELSNKAKIARTATPTLIIHGQYDQTLPVTEGQELYESSAATDKRILIIPGAGHNDIMMVDQGLYFDTIQEFVKSHS